jgi:5-methylcytosine-specific restriction endonuclease McrA
VSVRYYSAKRRRIMARGEDIDALKVFNDANWRCYYCGQIINSCIRYPSMWCATIEHIVPLSAGGEHLYSNVTASHRFCNEYRDRY